MGHLIQRYDPTLVALSLLIAILASHCALDLTARVSAARRGHRALWVLGGATAMGFGIWSMHFIGMLALQLPVPIWYRAGPLILSIVIAMLASGIALFVTSRDSLTQAVLATGAATMGVGIAGMHYVGMAAIAWPPSVHYHAGLWWLSIAIAVLVSGVALMLAFRLRERSVLWFPPRLAASVVMGLAIAGMHYTGMAAAQFPVPAQGVGPSGDWLIAARQLATPVAAASCLIFGLTMMVGVASARRRREGERILRRAAEALAVTGPEFFETVTRDLLQILDAQHAIIVTVESAAAERAETFILMPTRDG